MQNQGEFVADKVIGILVIVLSSCVLVCGVSIAAGLGLIGAGIFGAARGGGVGAAEAATAGSIVGLTGVALGGLLIVSSGISILIGWGISKSAKWAFLVGAVWYGLGLVANFVQFNVLGLLPTAGLLVYCVLRLSGSLGPKPA